MYRLLRRLLFLLPAEAAHRLAIWALSLLEGSVALCRHLRASALRGVDLRGVDLRCSVAGLKLENPIGLAAGLDKDAEAVPGFFALGFGFVEVGTVTPRPQPGNPMPRLFRLVEHLAVINRMGFNNHGARNAACRLRQLAFRPGPVGANIGKNKDTPLERAVDDYLACVDELADAADYLVVNASSPNTANLRQLQQPEALRELLLAVRRRLDERQRGKPLFLKIAPDLGPEAVDAIVDVAKACGVDGLIATNTTVQRPVEHPLSAETGGLSGAPLKPLSDAVIRRAYQRSGGNLPIVGVGGVFSGQDAYEKIRAGASAVQLYTGLIFEGPSLVRRILRDLAALLARDGFRSVAEAVGSDARSSPPSSTSSVTDAAFDGLGGSREHHR